MVNHCFCVGSAVGEAKRNLERALEADDIYEYINSVWESGDNLFHEINSLISEARQCNYKVIHGSLDKLKYAEDDGDTMKFIETALRVLSTDDCFSQYEEMFD